MPRLSNPLVVLLLALGLTGVSTGCATDQQVIAQAAGVHKQLQPSVVEQPAALAQYVQQVGDRIVKSGRELHQQGEFPEAEAWMFEGVEFHLVASPVMNAFTTGGKHVYLYSELFENSDTEAAYAAVVGHEFGHILGRHVQGSMNKQLLIGGGAAGAGVLAALLAPEDKRLEYGAAAAGVAGTAGAAVGVPYFTRSSEREADEYGFDLYINAGYPPEEFSEFFKTMIEKGYAEGGGGLNAYLGSHPELQNRVRDAEERAKKIGPQEEAKLSRPPIAGPQEFARLQEMSKPLTLAAAREAKQQQAATGTSAFLQSQQLLAGFPRCVGEPQRDE